MYIVIFNLFWVEEKSIIFGFKIMVYEMIFLDLM